MFGFGKKKKEEENITSDYDLLNSNDNTEEVYDDFGNPKYLKDGEDSFLNGTDDGDIESEEYLEEEEAVTEEYHPEDFINDDSENSDINEEEPEKKKGFFARLKEGLTKSRNSFAESFSNLFKANEIDDDFYDELEETLVMADLGVETTERIIDDLKDKVKEQKIKEAEACKQLIVNIIRDQMSVDDNAYDFEDKKTVVLVIGVNGVGKTTSIGKLAAQYKKRGKKVLMAAADTFRAAAIDQLKTWSNRAGVDIIAQGEGADPSAVVYDAVSAAKSRNTDILLIDTAGRLHNKKNLMDELAKMRRVISREYPEANVESLIVLDGTTGQNALEQARQFSSVTEINGIIITKLDGTAKGGIAIAIQSELNVPVKYIGIGEQIDDLQRFNPTDYVNALFADFDVKSDIEIIVDNDIEKIENDDDLFDV
ncbi:MAG: signal recognition particle-docking protein FtsY [Lachnospiraceae bacterium]|nr:signal recognition particle-docking protein FtsY [Lachnospiraceae bacterium]